MVEGREVGVDDGFIEGKVLRLNDGTLLGVTDGILLGVEVASSD